MDHLKREDLFSLEEYAMKRKDFRTQVMAHKRNRRVALGPNAHLYFEDRLTMQYQIQEMLRIEKIFEQDGIIEELEAYNPLIPDGSNLKATFMMEYADPEVRARALAQLLGIEKTVYIQVEGHEKVSPISNEDLERETEDKTSSVHFMRFEFAAEMIADMKAGKPVTMGVEHADYSFRVVIGDDVSASLVKDFA